MTTSNATESVVGVATTSAEGVRQTRDLSPDVALIDVILGTEFGFDLAHALARTVLKPPRTITMSTYAASDFAEMTDAGPEIGFLHKNSFVGPRHPGPGKPDPTGTPVTPGATLH